MCYSAAEQALLVWGEQDNGSYELVQLPKAGVRDSETKRGTGSSAVFIGRNRFAVLDNRQQQVCMTWYHHSNNTDCNQELCE